jgi:hypothetical protein
VGFSRPRRSKNPARSGRIPALSRVIKIVGFQPENPFRFTGPKHRPIVGGPVFPLRALALMALRFAVCSPIKALVYLRRAKYAVLLLAR